MDNFCKLSYLLDAAEVSEKYETRFKTTISIRGINIKSQRTDVKTRKSLRPTKTFHICWENQNSSERNFNIKQSWIFLNNRKK